MRILTFIVLALAAVYSGYWYFGASATERAATQQFVDLETAGWDVTYTDLSTAGFPSRFDTTIKDLTLVSKDGRQTWSLPFAQALSLAYKPNEIIFAFPPSQTLLIDGVPITLASDSLLASIAVSPTPSLALATVTAEVGAFSATADNQRLFGLTSGLAALRANAQAPHGYDAYLDLDGFALPDQLRIVLDPNGRLPATFGQVTVDSNLTFDADIDRHAAKTQPKLTGLDLKGMTIAWGPLQLRGSGSLQIDSAGVPTGKITLTAENWRQMIPLAVNAGILDAGVARTFENMAGLLSGGGTQLSTPISFSNGNMSLGPIPLGPAPRFR